ncbi:MAG TPA: hypothetical protein VJC16_02240 [Candidatus Nanoarchaeia archaeon]|nr:hypothetical protein [Candidatus Nanoarchaeia archaeon]
MNRWKYAKERKPAAYADYFIPPMNKETVITVKNWAITKKLVEGNNRTVFQGDVTSVDGKPTDRTFLIYHYDTVQDLKKRLKKHMKLLTLRLTRKYDQENMENYFDIQVV